MDPLCYVSHFALESEWDEIRRCCADKDTSALSTNLDMLFKWKKRKGPNATYQALLEIFQEKDERLAQLIYEYARKGHSQSYYKSEDLHFPKVNKRKDKLEFEKKYTEIKNKYIKLFILVVRSLEKTTTPKLLNASISQFYHQFNDDNNDVADIITNISSWFNIKVLQNVVDWFGSGKDKEELSRYRTDLLDYLQQSLFHIPAESFQNSNVTADSDVTICYLKILDDDVELLNLSGEDVLQIERNLADHFQIHYEVFNLCLYRLGCIELVFSIPTTLYESSSMLQQSTVPGEFQNELKLIVQLKDIL